MKNTKKHIVHVDQALKGIEEVYTSEKDKIEKSLKDFEKQRLKDHIDLVERRKKEVMFVKEKLAELKKEVGKRSAELKKHITSLKGKKTKEKVHFDTLYRLNEHLKNLESQIKDIDTSRRILLQKEKRLLGDVKHFFKTNSAEIKYHGLKNVTKINTILDKKTKIWIEASHSLGEDVRALFADKKVLEKMTDKQLDKVYKINNELRKLRDKHIKMLKESQTLKTEDYKFKQMLEKISQEKSKLLLQLKNI